MMVGFCVALLSGLFVDWNDVAGVLGIGHDRDICLSGRMSKLRSKKGAIVRRQVYTQTQNDSGDRVESARRSDSVSGSMVTEEAVTQNQFNV